MLNLNSHKYTTNIYNCSAFVHIFANLIKKTLPHTHKKSITTVKAIMDYIGCLL